MKIEINDKYRNLIFFLLITTIIICLFVVNNIGKRQNEVFAEDSIQYKYALQLLAQNNVTQAEPVLKELVEKYPENSEVVWKYAATQSALQNYEKAQALFQQAQDVNVTLIKEPLFLAQYGEVLYHTGELEKAKVYLEEVKKYNPSEQVLQSVNALLEEIQKKD